MRRLIGVELTRMRLRRAVWIMLALSLIGPAVIAFGFMIFTDPVDADDLARAEAQALEEAAEPFYQRELERCETRPQRFGISEGEDVETLCAEFILPEAEWFLEESQLDIPQLFRDNVGLAVIFVATPAIMLAAITYGGHDWNTGSMGNQLLAEPRRLRVWSAKLIAVTLVSGVFALAALALFWGWLFVVAGVRGLDVPGAIVELIVYQSLRGAALMTVASMAGYGLVMLTRATVGTIGLVFAYAVIFPVLALAFSPVTSGQWTPQVNAFAFVKDGVTLEELRAEECFFRPARRPDDCQLKISRERGGIVLGGLTVLVLAGSAASFRRRDIP